MRRGELLGLLWDDVGLETRTINVSRGVTFKYGRPIVGPLKTESSNRQITIPPPLLAELKKRRPDDWEGKYGFPSPTKAYAPMPESTLKRREMHYCKETGFVRVTEQKRIKKDGSEYLSFALTSALCTMRSKAPYRPTMNSVTPYSVMCRSIASNSRS